MNAVTIVIASMCILAIAYRLYGTFMMVKVLKVNDDKPTPAHALEDGKDYVPTNKWVSFEYHFAAIAAVRRWSDQFWRRSLAICRDYCGC